VRAIAVASCDQRRPTRSIQVEASQAELEDNINTMIDNLCDDDCNQEQT
jgi:hypothetical protein